jgi:hypothetical protein
MASSDMALLGVLRRYRSLLAQAHDAAQWGRPASRSLLRSLVGDETDQLVMWGLFPPAATAGDLVLGDLVQLESLIEEVRESSQVPDRRCRRLMELVADRVPTLVFSGSRDTVRFLKGQVSGAAWCTGNAAGIGITPMERDDVLSWFRPGAAPGGPHVLITTDVAAEGLDLQHASRVVHYDLPWTAVRMDQRDGRAIRLGSLHREVEVVRFSVAPAIERRLGQLSRLARKRRLPGQAGIDARASRPWAWREELAARFGAIAPTGPGRYARVDSDRDGLLVAVAFQAAGQGGGPSRVATIAGFLAADGAWSDDPALVLQLMAEAADAGHSAPARQPDSDSLIRASRLIQGRLGALHQAQWSHHLTPLEGRVIARLNRIAARAVQARKGPLLSSVARALDCVRRGHTAGEALWLEKLLALSEAALIREIRQCPEPGPRPTTLESELLGLIQFAPSCSTLTAP